MLNWQEWRAGTIPINALSVFSVTNITATPSSIRIKWQSVSTRKYIVERAGALLPPAQFETLATNVLYFFGTIGYIDTTATNSGPYFYRVGIH